MPRRGGALVCFALGCVFVVCCAGDAPPSRSTSGSGGDGAAELAPLAPRGGPGPVAGSAEPFDDPTPGLEAASEDLGSRLQVRALDLPRLRRGATTSFELPTGGAGWITALPESGLGVTPAFGHGRVFVGGGFASSSVYALDARTGRIDWRVDAPDGGPTAAIVDGEKLIFNTESCTIFVVDAGSGQLLWSRWLGDPLMSQPAAADGRVFSAHPSDMGGYAMTAMSLATGRVLWTRAIPADVVSAPALAGDSIYFTTLDGTVFRLSQDAGRVSWRQRIAATTAPWVDGERVMLARRVDAPAGQQGPFEAQVVLDAAAGTILREGEPIAARHLAGAGRARALIAGQDGAWGDTGRGARHLGLRNVAEGWAYQGARPTVIDGRAYQVEGDRVLCRDVASGRVLWSRRYARDGGALAVSPPAVAGAQMVVATVDGQVYGLDIDTGMAVWAYDVGEPVVFQPSIARGWVYLATARGRIVAFPVGDASLDGWHMWGGGPTHEGPLEPAPARPAETDDEAEDGPGQGTLSVILPDEHRVEQLPLARTSFRATVSGFVASVVVTQVFENAHAEPLEAAYHFPLPTGAAVDAMEVVAGDRRIVARIEQRDEARLVYRQARDAGLLAALLEQQRPNLFTQRVANIPPGRSVRVELHYVQMIPYDQGTYELLFPMVAGARAADPTADGAADDELAQHAPGTRPRDVDVTVDLDAGLPLVDVDSPSHLLDVDQRSASRAVISLAAEDRIPDRDLVIRYGVAGEVPEVALLAHRDDRGGFFTLILQPARADGAQIAPTRRRITLALDTSSSLHGPAMEQARAVATTALQSLLPDDELQVVAFSDMITTFAPAPVAATDENVVRAQRWIDELRALGTTSMTAGLETALAQGEPAADVLDMVVLVTDGYVTSEVELLRLVEERLGHRRLAVVGVGPGPNRFLLEQLGELGRGTHLVVSPADDPEVVAQDFLERVDSPQVTDLEIDWGELSVDSVYPRRLPDLFAGQPLLIHGRYELPGEGTVRVRGRVAGRRWEADVAVVLPDGGDDHDAMASVWARAAVDDWMNRLWLRDDPDAEEAVTRLGLDFGLVTRFTSFVAVDSAALQSAASERPAATAGGAVVTFDRDDSPGVGAAMAAPASRTAAPQFDMPYEAAAVTRMPERALEELARPTPARVRVDASGRAGSDAVRAEIARHEGEIRAAGVRLLGADGGGSIAVRLRIDASGRVASAEIESSTVGNSELEQALLSIFRAMTFPAAEPGVPPTTIVHTVTF